LVFFYFVFLINVKHNFLYMCFKEIKTIFTAFFYLFIMNIKMVKKVYNMYKFLFYKTKNYVISEFLIGAIRTNYIYCLYESYKNEI